MSVFEELKRRRVFRVTSTYAVVAWVIMQIGEVVFPALRLPEWVLSTVVILLLIGFPLVIIFAWIFDATPDGIKITKPKSSQKAFPSKVSTNNVPFYLQKRNAFLVLGLVFGLLIGNLNFFKNNQKVVNYSGERISIAIADFENKTNDASLDGLSGLLITSLEQSDYLSVLTRSRMFDILKQIGRPNAKIIDEKIGSEICANASIGSLVIASIMQFGDLYSIDLKILDTKSNEYIFTKNVQADGKRNIPDLIDNISRFTRISLAENAEEVERNQKEVASLTTKNLEAYKFYDIGEKALFSREWSFAEENFSKAIEIDSNFALALYQLAYINQWFFDNKKADYYIKRAVKNINSVPEKERLYIRAQSISDFSSRIPLYEEILEKFPNEKQAYFEIGDMLFHSGPALESIPYFEKSLELDPSFEVAINHLGWMYSDIKDYEKYSELYKRSLSIYPDKNNYKRYELYADLYSGKFETYFNRLRDIEDKDIQFLNTDKAFGDGHLLNGNFSKAEERYLRLVESKQTQLDGYTRLRDYHTYRADEKNFKKYSDLILTEFVSKNDYKRYLDELSRRSYTLIHVFDDFESAKKITMEINSFFLDKKNKISFDNLGLVPRFYLAETLKELKQWSLAKAYEEQSFRNLKFLINANEALRQKQSGNIAESINYYEKALNLSATFHINKLGYDLSKLYYESGDYEKVLQQTDDLKKMTHQTYPRSRQFYYAKYFLYSGLANYKLKNFRLAKSNLDIFLKIYEPASENLKYKKMARDAIADMKKLRS